MLQDKVNWNQKYCTKKYPNRPSQIVKDHYSLAPGKRALDIGAGNGRNSLFLSHHGFSVDAVDISEEGLKLFAGNHSNIYPICADLDAFDFPTNRYDLIVNIKFLNRRLFPCIREGLKKDGILIFESFLETGCSAVDKKMSRDYLLKKNELLRAFMLMHIIYYREKTDPNKDASGMASLIAVKAG